MRVLSKDALDGLAKYKYKPGTYTYLDNAMTPFWNSVVQLLPMYMAPNLVTLIGTSCVVSSTLLLCYYSPQLNEAAPSWVYWNCCIAVFIYQTLDAIDGKQARRTGSSSPLGQLFDHGCDALCSVFNTVSAATAVGYGATCKSFTLMSVVCWSFYLAQWDEYHTGTMCSGNGWFGVTEGQFFLMLVHAVTAIYTPSIWTATLIDGLSFAIRDVLMLAFIVSNSLLCAGNLKNVIVSNPDSLTEEELGKKQVSKKFAVLQLGPMSMLFGLGFLWIYGPGREAFEAYPSMYMFSIGIGFVLITTRMIICHMAKVPYTLQLRTIVPLLFVLLNASSKDFGLRHHEPWVDELKSLFAFTIYIVVVYLYYVILVISQICERLGIRCLTIPYIDNKNK